MNKKRPAKYQTELEGLHNKYLRALADYQNLEKRMEQALEQARRHTKTSTLQRVIHILDDIEKAEVFVKDDGLQIVKGNFVNMLAEMGVEELHLEGTEYDPNFAEVVEVVSGETDNIVTEIVRKGYRIGQDILRPAQVKVSRRSSGSG